MGEKQCASSSRQMRYGFEAAWLAASTEWIPAHFERPTIPYSVAENSSTSSQHYREPTNAVISLCSPTEPSLL